MSDYEPGEKEPLKHGVKIRGKIKRGTDTRDQDTLVIEGRGEDAAEAREEFEDALHAAERDGWAERLRAINPAREERESE